LKLLLDIGNTRVKWAWHAGGQLEQPGSCLHRGRPLAAVLEALPLCGPAPAEVLAGSVASAELTGAIADAVRDRWSLPLRLAEAEPSALGVRSGYADPRQLGVDRWLAIVAAYQRHQAQVCVVDAGTAVTIDLVRADGLHLGGLILPGLELMQEALHRSTGRVASAARMRAAAPEPPVRLGRDTASCLQHGALLAITCLVRYCTEAFHGVEEAPAVLVMTGGDAPALLPLLGGRAEHRPLLVLEGLAMRYADD
jgi:type III pantothenate kinase